MALGDVVQMKELELIDALEMLVVGQSATGRDDPQVIPASVGDGADASLARQAERRDGVRTSCCCRALARASPCKRASPDG